MTAAERKRRSRNAVTKPGFVTTPPSPMTSGERQSILVVIRARERVAIADAREYQAVLMANFEQKLAAIYKPEDHPV
jgi:hypothetical protein